MLKSINLQLILLKLKNQNNKKSLQDEDFFYLLKQFAQPNSFIIFATEWFHYILKFMRRDVYQAIADPTRRAILTLIAAQALTPNAIAENFNTTRQAISKHLKILNECELIESTQQGREIYYSLQVEKMKEIDQWLEQFRMYWETRFNQLDDLLETMKNKKI